MTASNSRTGASGAHGNPPIAYPKAAARLRSMIAGGALAPRIVKSWLEVYGDYLRTQGILYDDEAKIRFINFNRHQLFGSQIDLRSNLFVLGKRANGDIIRESYENIIRKFDVASRAAWSSSGFIGKNNSMCNLYDDVEAKPRENFGPRSVFAPWFSDGPEKVRTLMTTHYPHPKFDRGLFKEVVARIVEEIPENLTYFKPYKQIVGATETRSSMAEDDYYASDPNTNSGEPFDSHGWRPSPALDSKENARRQFIFDYYVRRAQVERDLYVKGKVPPQYALLGIRHNVPHGPDPLSSVKTKRIVNMMPKSNLLNGRQVVKELYDAYRPKRVGTAKSLIHVAWNDITQVDLEIRRFHNYCAAHNLEIVSCDYSQYDATISPDLVEELALGYNKRVLRDGGYFMSSMAQSVFSKTGFVTPTEVYLPNPSGVKSGDVFTNFWDSQMNKAVMYYGEMSGKWEIAGAYVQGDDAVIAGPGVTSESFQEVAGLFGFSANADKQYVSRDYISFLKRMQGQNLLGGVFSAYGALNSITSLERLAIKPEEFKTYGPFLQAVQTIAKLSNVVFNPSFEALVRFVREGDVYQLGAKMHPDEVIKRAGPMATELIRDHAIPGASVAGQDLGKWGENPVNIVLRGGSMPPIGTADRFRLSYGQTRVLRAEENVGINVKEVLNGGY